MNQVRAMLAVPRFGISDFELYVATWAVAWGVLVLAPGISLIESEVYSPLRRIALGAGADPDLLWGVIAFLVGVLQVITYYRFSRVLSGRCTHPFNLRAWRVFTLSLALVWWSWLGFLLILGRPGSTAGYGHLLAAAVIAVVLVPMLVRPARARPARE